MLMSVKQSFRLLHIGYILARHDALFPFEQLQFSSTVTFIGCLFRKKNKATHEQNKEKYQGQCLRNALIALGPTFVKIGQTLSVRSDIIGKEIAEELSQLQDKMPHFPFEKAKNILEKDFKRPLGEIFLTFQEKPIAAASISQVHFATTHSGDEVAVKILRPKIRTAFEKDIALFKWIAQLIEKKRPSLRRFRPTESVLTVEKTILTEIDMLMEAAAAEELAENFKNEPLYAPPKIYWDLTTQNILTLERISGIPIDEREQLLNANLNPNIILAKAAECFFYQVFRDGFFHADMHGGNAFIGENGRIIPVDFGMMGRLNRQMREYLAETLIGLLEGNYRRVAIAHYQAGFIGEDVSIEDFTQACRAVGAPIHGQPLHEISYGNLLGQMFRIMETFNIYIQPQLLLLQKTMVMAEGMGKTLSPEANMWELAYPLIQQWTKKHLSPEAKLLYRVADFKETLKKLPHMIQKLDEIVSKAALFSNDKGHDKEGRKNTKYHYGIFLLGSLVGFCLATFYGL